MNRRRLLQTLVGSSAAAFATGLPRQLDAATILKSAAEAGYKIRNTGIKHSVMGWCFKPMEMPTLIEACADIGLKGMEGIDRRFYPAVKKAGMEISLVGSHGFANGPCNPANRDEVITKLTDAIEVAAEVGSKKAITFTGMRYEDMDQDEAVKNCIDTWKQVLPLAEKKGITLVLEHLNSRDDSHPMKGHPGYFGDDVDFCVDLIHQVGSENFKLLFDVYHVSIMNGDVIRRIDQFKDSIGHYHTAGNPGRCELDEHQEIYYPAVIQAVIESGYDDFVAHEFIPTWDDPILALRHAAMVCDY
jgi:hydroxypyruvate isomerase